MTSTAPGVETRADQAEGRGRSLWSGIPSWAGALVALIVLVIFTAIRSGGTFLQPENLVNILNQNAEVGIIAVGMTLVIILGGIDLSVGSLMALAGGLGMLTLNALHAPGESATLAVAGALAVMLGTATAAGALNGLLISYGRLAPFIATLGALVAYRSGATWIANGGQFFSEGVPAFLTLRGGVPIAGVRLPYAVILFALTAVVGWVLLNKTRFGRYVFAVGSNERAATYSAIAVQRIKLLTYVCLGLATGLAAIVHAVRFQSVNSANAGLLIELEVIAAVVIGGTRMEGGSGSIVGTIVGVLLIGVIKNMLVMLNVTSFAHGLVMGLIIIGAVLVQHLGRRR